MRFVYSWFSSVCDKVSTNEAVARVLTLSTIKCKLMTIQKLARYWYWSEHSPAFRTTVYWVTRLCIRTCLGKRRGWNSKKLHVTLIDKKSLSQQWQYLQRPIYKEHIYADEINDWFSMTCSWLPLVANGAWCHPKVSLLANCLLPLSQMVQRRWYQEERC